MWKRFNKTDRRILSAALLLLLLMLYLLYDDSLILPSDNSDQPGIARVTSANNDVRRKLGKQFLWRSARRADTIHKGDAIFTGQGSEVILEFKDGRKLTLQENSMIVVNSDGDQLNLDLQFGRFNGTLGAGTKVTVNGKDLEIKDGQVDVDADGTVKSAKHQTLAPIAWMTAPSAQFFHHKHNVPLALSWKTSQVFGRYRLQFSRNEDFKKISYQEIVRGNSVETIGYPANGKFFVRVEAQDLKGKPVATTTAVTMSIQELDAPHMTNPKNQQILTFKSDVNGDFETPPWLQVEWTYPLKSITYEIQMSTDAKFSALAWENKPKDSKATTPTLKPGVYFLRVKDTTVLSGHELPWSPTVQFTVKYDELHLKAPKLLTKRINHVVPSKDNVVFEWTSVDGNPQYQVDVSDTPDFVNKQTYATPQTHFNYKNFSPGRSYFRVFAVTKKGTLSEPSDVGQLQVKVSQPIIDAVAPRIVRGKTPEDPGDPQDFNVSWTDLQLADSYVVQVAEDPGFRQRQEYEVKKPNTVLTVQKPGQYYVRVKGVDAVSEPISRYSDPAILQYKLQVPLSTPELVEPFDRMTLFFQMNTSPYVWLEWKAVRQAVSYNIEVAMDSEFQQRVFAVTSRTRRFLIKDKLPQGNLYWRVQAVGEGDQTSYWSKPNLMTVYTGRAPLNRLPANRRR